MSVFNSSPRQTFASSSIQSTSGPVLSSLSGLRDTSPRRSPNNPQLKGVLSKDYNRPALDKMMLGELIDLISGMARAGQNLAIRPELTGPRRPKNHID